MFFLRSDLLDKIKFISYKNQKKYFEIPYEWLSKGTQGPTLNDLEKTAERGSTTAYLTRVRSGEVPAATLDICKRLTQKELFPLLEIIRETKIYIYYFEKYLNKFITREFYVQKINPPWHKLPLDNNTDNIEYEPFTINFSGYGDVNE